MSQPNDPPAGTHFHRDAGLLVWRPEGVIIQSVVDELIAYLDELELRQEKPFNRFTDSLKAEAIDVNYRYIITVSLYRRVAYSGPAIKSAILVNDPAMARYARLHAVLTQGSAIKVRLFEERQDVAEWLDTPLELLL
jgi:hypothetical protein